jgi:hypothetical protein
VQLVGRAEVLSDSIGDFIAVCSRERLAGSVIVFLIKPSPSECRPRTQHLPETPAPAAGAEKEMVEIEAPNLEPGQTYTFCLIEFHESEEVESVSLTFTTPAGPTAPFVFHNIQAREVTPFAATLEGKINPERQSTTYSFKYATNIALTENAHVIPGPEALPAEFAALEVSAPTGNVLTANTTYFYQVIAKNTTGTTEGPVEQFTTREEGTPEVISTTVAALNSSEPKIEAKINPDYEETSYQFEYSTEESGGELAGTITIVKGAPPLPLLPGVSEEREAGPVGLPGLSPGPTYFYRVTATNATGSVHGPVQSFQALAVPALSGVSVQGVTRTTATVLGEIIPQGLPSTYHVAYVTQESYEEGAPNPYANGRNTYETKLPEPFDYTAHPLEIELEELEPATTYHYSLVASNELGTTSSLDGTFTTSATTPPSATTGSAEGVGALSASISGSVNTQGLKTAAYFEFGSTPYSGELIPATESGSGNSFSITASFSNLLPDTTYYFRAVATSVDGTAYGALQSFTTTSFPAVIAIPANPTPIPYPTIAQLNTKEAHETPKLIPPPTTAQLLAKALKACQHKPKHQRPTCRRKAHQKYAPKRPTRHK